MKYPEAAPYVTEVGFGAQYAAALIVNKGVYNKLPPALQKILREVGQEWTAARRQGAARRRQRRLRHRLTQSSRTARPSICRAPSR